MRTRVTASFDHHIVHSLIHLAAALLDKPPEKTAGAAFGRPAKGGASARAVGSSGVRDEFAGGVDLADADAAAAAEGIEGAAAVPVAGGGAGAGAQLQPVAVSLALIDTSRARPAAIDSNAAGAPHGADDADDDTSAKVLDGARHAGGC